MNYKLIACDLDGTLMGTDLTLSEENKRAIKELTEQGIIVVPTTGRTIVEMREVFDLPEIRYVIYSNGAVIADKETGEEIFCGLNEELAHFVLTTLFKYDTYVVIHKNGQTYCDREKLFRPEDYNVCYNTDELVKRYCIAEDEFERNSLNGGCVENVAVYFASLDDMKECRKILESNPDIRAVEGWEFSLEIFSKKAGKGSALKILTEKLGIDMQEIITIGDSDNDTQMTKMSGLGLAAGNACEMLKEVADEVICTNDEHVLKFVKEKFFS